MGVYRRLAEGEGNKSIMRYFGDRGTSTLDLLEQICSGNAYREKVLRGLGIKI